MPLGYLCLVLHAHLPYVRHPEYDDFLEEDWLYEAITETYIPLLEVFDAPSVVTNCTIRNTSTVPLQALALLNSDFARNRASAFARRLAQEAGGDPDKRTERAFRLAYGRKPQQKELDLTKRFLAAQCQIWSKEKDGEQRAWIDFCQMVLASNSFIYVE